MLLIRDCIRMAGSEMKSIFQEEQLKFIKKMGGGKVEN